MEDMVKSFIGDVVVYDKEGGYFWGKSKNDSQMIAQVRGWGAIQNIFTHATEEEAGAFQDSLGEFIAEAINEKLTPPKEK